MRKDLISKTGIAAAILLAPGGFVLGLALLVRHYRGRLTPAPADRPSTDAESA